MKFTALWLSGLILFVFLLQQFLPSDLFVLDARVLWEQPWRILLSLFAHGSVLHLLGNLFSLSFFGLILEARIGPQKVFWLFLAGGVLLNLFPLYAISLGASGGIFVLIGTLLILRPFFVVWVNFFPLPMFLAVVFMFISTFIMDVATEQNVAHLTHLAGLVLGIVAGFYLRNNGLGDKMPKLGFTERDELLEKQLDNWEEQYMR